MLVSIIIPCYNVEDYVHESIDSVLNQSYDPIEIIVVDNRSTDNTLNILKRYEREYPQQIKLLEAYQAGAPIARNKGLSIAKGQWIQFLDADDILLKDKIRNQLALIDKAEKTPDFIAGSYRFVTMDGNQKNVFPDISDPWAGLLWSSIGNTCANLWRKQSLDAINGWNETLKSSQEYDLMFRLLRNGAMLQKEESVSTIVRQRPHSISTAKDQASNYKRRLQVSLRVLEYLKDFQLDHSPASYQKIELGVLRDMINFGKYDLQKASKIYEQTFKQKLKLEGAAFSRVFTLLYKYANYQMAQSGFNFYSQLKKYLGLEHYKLPLP